MEHDAQSSRRYKENWDDAVQMMNKQDAEIEALRKDAERYRWIKSRRGLTLKTDGAQWTRPDGSRFVATHYLAEGGKQHSPADSLDAVIDAAMLEAPRVGAA